MLTPIRPTGLVVFVVVAAVFGVAYVFITPLLDAPDESAHYWRTDALAHGAVLPKAVYQHGYTALPGGARELVTIGGMPRLERQRPALAVSYIAERVVIRYPLTYSPLPYAPAAIGCAAGDALRLRPLFTFYLGRLCNLAAAIALVGLAIRIRPDAQWIFCACALMPMTLFLFASFSPDAVTIGTAFVAAALALAGSPWVIAAAIALALCKPAYVFVPLLALAVRGRRVPIVAAVIASAFVGASFVKTTAFMRPGTDAHQQIAFVMHHPFIAAAAIAGDLVRRAPLYLDEMIGRLGWLTVALPMAVIAGMAALLVAVAWFAGPGITRLQRLLAALIALASVGVVGLSQYIVWTPVGAGTLDGVQGRYFIPILPLILIAVSRPASAPRWLPSIVIAAAAIANAAALAALRF